jgi:fumarate hydratase class II
LARRTGLPFREAENHFEAQSSKDAIVEASGALRTVAVSLSVVANNVRWLASGPRCGIGEIQLPEVQPGSSIMPGKVNPVIAESAMMAAAQVLGNDLTVTIGGQSGVFELNVMMPVMAHNVLESIRLLSTSAANLSDRCVSGIRVDAERCEETIEKSLAMVTALAPVIGYDAAVEIAHESYGSRKTVREIALRKKVLPRSRLREILNPLHMTEPGVAKRGK